MKRRDFLKTVAIAGGAAAVAAAPHGPVRAAQSTQGEKGDPQPLYRKLPRWRGFNLLEKFNARNDRFVEADFQWIQEWGFDFVRLPMDYRVVNPCFPRISRGFRPRCCRKCCRFSGGGPTTRLPRRPRPDSRSTSCWSGSGCAA